MSKITWTHELRVDMYKRVIKEFGTPFLAPTGSRGKPYGMSEAGFLNVLDTIGYDMGLGKGKGGALSNQIAWAHYTPKSCHHNGYWNNYYRNISAAEEAGYYGITPDIPYQFNIFTWFIHFLQRLF